MVTAGASGGNFGFVAAGVADERESVGVEIEWEEATGAEGLPATMVADGKGGGAAAVVEDHGLSFVV